MQLRHVKAAGRENPIILELDLIVRTTRKQPGLLLGILDYVTIAGIYVYIDITTNRVAPI